MQFKIDINIPEFKNECKLVPMEKIKGRDMKMY